MGIEVWHFILYIKWLIENVDTYHVSWECHFKNGHMSATPLAAHTQPR